MIRTVSLGSANAELTLACPNRCIACGSDAGRARPDELTVREWTVVFRDIAALGAKRVTFSGGEPLVRPDWPRLARAAAAAGLMVDLITSGAGVDDAAARAMRRARLDSVTVSVDGTRDAHDRLRGAGSWDRALAALRRLDGAGLRVAVSTQVNRASLPTLAALAGEIERAGALAWRLQLTMPSGRAAGCADVVLDGEGMLRLHALLRRLRQRRGLRPTVADNIGYGTRDDALLRTPARLAPRCWMGCFAGLRAVAITSDGGVKGCLSLPDSWREGNVRTEPLARIWNDPLRFAWNRAFDPATLGGACATCPLGPLCRGGCTATAVALAGAPGRFDLCLRHAREAATGRSNREET
jgi:radical SAM protein with 4Fe4S-binding SPASM domain